MVTMDVESAKWPFNGLQRPWQSREFVELYLLGRRVRWWIRKSVEVYLVGIGVCWWFEEYVEVFVSPRVRQAVSVVSSTSLVLLDVPPGVSGGSSSALVVLRVRRRASSGDVNCTGDAGRSWSVVNVTGGAGRPSRIT